MFCSRGPENSRRGRFWEWWNPALGKTINGWLAGPIVGLETHFLGKTQPCRRYVTGGRMECYCDRMQLSRVWKGYIPVLNADGVKGFAIFGERAWDLASKIVVGQPVGVTRERWSGQPIMVRVSNWTDQPIPSESGRHKPLDMRAQLLRMWGDADLSRWFQEHDPEDEAVRQVEGKQAKTPRAISADRPEMKPAKPLPGTLKEAIDKAMARNGRHKVE